MLCSGFISRVIYKKKHKPIQIQKNTVEHQMVLTPKWTTCPDALRKSQTVTVSLSKFAKESVDYGTHHSSTLER